MLKFFHSTASVSTPCHIALEESGMKYTPVEIKFKDNVNVDELEKVNPLGRVPAILNAEGKSLTQNTAILEYIADLNPASKLLAPQGSWERVETMQWVAFSVADFNKAFIPFFTADKMTTSEAAQTEIKKSALETIQEYLRYVDQSLAGKKYIVGDHFTIADCHLFTMLGWCSWVELNVAGFRNITAYMKRVSERPAVQKVLKEEDLF